MIPEPTGPTVIAFFAKEVYNKSLSDSGWFLLLYHIRLYCQNKSASRAAMPTPRPCLSVVVLCFEAKFAILAILKKHLSMAGELFWNCVRNQGKKYE